MDFPEPEFVKLVRQMLRLIIVRLVRNKNDFLGRSTETPRNFLVQRTQPRQHIHDKQNGHGGLDRRLHLRLDRLIPESDFALFSRKHRQSAGIDQIETAPFKNSGSGDAVARHAAVEMHNRLASAQNRIEKRRFADVRAADDRNHRQAQRGIGDAGFFIDLIFSHFLFLGFRGKRTGKT